MPSYPHSYKASFLRQPPSHTYSRAPWLRLLQCYRLELTSWLLWGAPGMPNLGRWTPPSPSSRNLSTLSRQSRTNSNARLKNRPAKRSSENFTRSWFGKQRRGHVLFLPLLPPLLRLLPKLLSQKLLSPPLIRPLPSLGAPVFEEKLGKATRHFEYITQINSLQKKRELKRLK